MHQSMNNQSLRPLEAWWLPSKNNNLIYSATGMFWLILATVSIVGLGCSQQPPHSPLGSSSESSAPAVVAAVTPTAVSQPRIVALVGPLKNTLDELLSLTLAQEKAARPASATDTVAEVRKRIRANQLDQMINRRLYLLERN
mgnify:CR=1 FL=1